MKPRRLLSFLTRTICLLAVIFAVTIPTSFVVSSWLVRTDPFLAVDNLTSYHSIYPAIISAAVLIITCFLPRFFCQWFCPFGLMLDICRLGASLLEKCHFPVIHLHRSYKILGRLFLLLIIIAPFAGGMSLFLFDPTALTFILAGYKHTSTLLVAAAVFPIIGTLFIPNLWCGILCPCGTLSDIVYHSAQTILKVTGLKKKKIKGNKDNKDNKDNKEASPVPQERRSFLRKGVIFGLGIAVVGGITLFLRKTVHFVLDPIRPAGSAAEPKFSRLCTRCGACMKVCPTKVLVRLDEKNGSFQTPILDFDASYCEIDCHRCGDVCPTGAIRSLSVEQKQKKPSMEIQVNLDGCRLWNDRECAVCKTECPLSAITFVWDEKEYINLPKIEKSLCTGCGQCVHFCPGFEGIKGLTAVPVNEPNQTDS